MAATKVLMEMITCQIVFCSSHNLQRLSLCRFGQAQDLIVLAALHPCAVSLSFSMTPSKDWSLTETFTLVV